MRVLRELLEMAGEEDIPVIYDIIKRKLEAGAIILLVHGTRVFGQRQVFRLEKQEQSPLWTPRVLLHWSSYDPGKKPYGDTFSTPAEDLSKWKLTKAEDHWELET
jgi:hypothetical protein